MNCDAFPNPNLYLRQVLEYLFNLRQVRRVVRGVVRRVVRGAGQWVVRGSGVSVFYFPCIECITGGEETS